MADCAALEMPCPGQPGPGVRIPLSPLKRLTSKASDERRLPAHPEQIPSGRLFLVQNPIRSKAEADP